MVTIYDVALKAGVSAGTVSNVINNKGKFSKETKEKVLNAINELHYIQNQVARGLRKSNTRSIGIICEDVNSVFSAEMIDGICDYAEKQEYNITLLNLGFTRKMAKKVEFKYDELESTETFQNYVRNSINSLLTARVNGIIYAGIYPRYINNLLSELSIPVVHIYSYTNGDKHCVNYDDFQGAKLAVDHLIQNNHKRIGLIGGAIDSISSHKRMLGYQTSLMENNIPFYPEYIWTGNWHYEDGSKGFRALMNLKHPPTSIFIMSDLMAYGAMNYAKDCSISIPDDVSIIGFDDLQFSQYSNPSLSSIHVPLNEMGQYSAQALIELIENKSSENKTKFFPCELKKRNSVKTISL